MLSVHPCGFYAWVKEPLSHRALEDARQAKLVKKAWQDSGKVYGYRKICDDLVDMGETASENRVARLVRLAGIQAQIGYKKKPGAYTVANLPSSSTTRWIVSSLSMRRTEFG